MTDSPETPHGPIYERLAEALRKLSQGKQDEYYRALGMITVNFARVDTGTSYLLGLLTGAKPEIARSLVGDMNLSRRLGKLRDLIPIAISNRDNQTITRQVVDRIDKARSKRNELIHSIWYLLGKETGIRYDHRKGSKHSVSLKDLDDFNTVLEVLLLDLIDLEKLLSSFDQFNTLGDRRETL